MTAVLIERAAGTVADHAAPGPGPVPGPAPRGQVGSWWRGLLARLVLLVGVAVVGGSQVVSPAAADEMQDAYDRCVSEQKDVAAVKEMIKSGEVEAPEGWRDLFPPLDKVQEVKDAHPDRVKEITDHYEQDQGWKRKLGRIGNGGLCTMKKPLDAAAENVSEFWEDPVGKFAKSVIEGNEQALQMVMTFWMDFDMGKAMVESNSTGVINIMWVIVLGAMVVNLIIVGARMVWLRRQGVADGLEEVGGMFWNAAIYSIVLPAGIFSAVGATDVLSHAILENFGASDAESFLDGVNLGPDQAGPIMMLLVAGLAFAGSAVQFLAMVARVLILPVLIGLMPLFAGISATDWGRQALASARNWLIALVLYKPVAALFYCVAFWVHDNIQGDGIVWTAVRGLAVGLAGFSILSLAKVIIPGMASMGGGNSAAMGAAMGAATGAVTAGAMTGIGGVAGMAGKAATGAGKAISGGGAGGGSAASKSATGAARSTAGGGSGGGGGGVPAASPSGTPAGATGASATTGSGGTGGSGAAQAGGGAGASGAGHTSSAASGGGGAAGGGAGSPAGSGAVATSANHAAGESASPGSGSAGGGGAAGHVSGGTGGAGRVRGAAGTAMARVGQGGATVARGAAAASRIARAAGRTAGAVSQHTGMLFDDSIGSSGHPGQIRR